MSKGKRKTPAADADYMVVVVGGSYMADKDMAARLAKGDRPSYDDIRPHMKQVKPGDRIRVADLHPWTLEAMIDGGFFGEEDDDAPWTRPAPEPEPEEEWTWPPTADDEEVTDGDDGAV